MAVERWDLGDPDKDVRGEVLDDLNGGRVFAVERRPDGFHFYERCDEYFGVTLTREQVKALAHELLALVEQEKLG